MVSDESAGRSDGRRGAVGDKVEGGGEEPIVESSEYLWETRAEEERATAAPVLIHAASLPLPKDPQLETMLLIIRQPVQSAISILSSSILREHADLPSQKRRQIPPPTRHIKRPQAGLRPPEEGVLLGNGPIMVAGGR